MQNWQFIGLIMGIITLVLTGLLTVFAVTTRIDSLYSKQTEIYQAITDTQNYLSKRMDDLGGRIETSGDNLGDRIDIMNARMDAFYTLIRTQYETRRLEQETN